ncbi:MAG: TVP38/TMEM64 family protein, partial [Rubrimonas sp.]
MGEGDSTTAAPSVGARLRRAAPLIALVVAAVLAAVLLGDALGYETLERHRHALRGWAADNALLAAAAFVLAYAAAVAVSAPGALWFTISGGLIFGTALGAALSVTGATLGATAIFLAARSGLGQGLRARAGGWMARLGDGFRRNEVEFMLALRLAPVAPFFIVNLVPAFLGVSLRTF